MRKTQLLVRQKSRLGTVTGLCSEQAKLSSEINKEFIQCGIKGTFLFRARRSTRRREKKTQQW